MTVSHIGALSLGACVPLAASATAGMSSAVTASLPSVSAKVTGLLEAQASLTLTPPSLAASIAAAQAAILALEAAITAGVPGADFQLAAVGAALATAQAELGALNAQLQIAAGFDLTLGTPGVHLYALSGNVPSIGAEVAAEFSGGLPGGTPLDQGVGVLLIASDASAQAALSAAFAI